MSNACTACGYLSPRRRFTKPAEKRSRLIQVRVTAAHHAALRARATQRGTSLAEVVRQLIAIGDDQG